MEESSKHSPRVDEELHHETRSIEQGQPVEAHTREDLHQQDLPPDAATRPDGPATPDGVDIDRRAALAAVLRPSAFPGTRERLLAAAGEEHAPPELLEALGALPGGVSFQRFEEAWEALGGGREGSSR